MNFPNHKMDFLALAGGAAVLLGSFAPAAEVALYGSVSYWEAAGPEALIMICGAIGAIVCLAIGRHWLAKASTSVMWIALLWPYLQGLMEPEPEGLFETATAAVADTTSGFATDIALNFVDITWGTIALAVGCLCVTIGAIGKR